MNEAFNARAVMLAVTANRDKLDACPAHDFGNVPLPYTFGQRFVCLNCKGEMKAVDAFRYIQGYEAAGGDPNNVLQGYRPDWKPTNEEQAEGVLQRQHANTHEAHNRIFDLLLGDDGQAYKEAQKYLEREAPELYLKLYNRDA